MNTMNPMNPMQGQLGEMQKLGQANLDSQMRVMADMTKAWQSIAAEMGDYTKRSFEHGNQTMEKLMAAKSMEQAMEIQSAFVRRSFEDYMQQWSKLSTMYMSMTKDAYAPVERMLNQR